MQISNNSTLKKILEEFSKSQPKANIKSDRSSKNKNIAIKNLQIKRLNLSYFNSTNIHFTFCTFENCSFDDFEFYGIEFKNCKFIDCTFQNTIFMECGITECFFNHPFSNTLYFGMTSIEETKIKNCEFQFTIFFDCMLQNLKFEENWFYNGKFEPGDFYYAHKSRLLFNNIDLSSIIFIDLDLTQSNFKNCDLNISLVNSKLSSNTILTNRSSNLCNIDLSTIKNSEILSANVLKNNFGITNNNIKEDIKYFTSIAEFFSVFISYSFKDAELGRELNKLLKENKLKTFFWEIMLLARKKLKR